MKILHLYYDLMNLYGEYGNVVVLNKHLLDQGIDCSIDKKSIGNDIDFKQYDFIYAGSGSEKNEILALNDLKKRSKSLNEAIDNGSIIFLTGGAMELLGKKVNNEDGLGIVDISTEFTNNRYTGDVILKNDSIGEVVGFINKCSIIKHDESIKLFDYVFKDSNLPSDKVEGYHVGNIYGTHVIGPILVKNPNLMKHIVLKLLEKENVEYKDIDYKFEDDSYNVTLNALKERIEK